MQLLHLITTYFLDLLFPKDEDLRALESELSRQDVYNVFPPAHNIPEHSIILFDYKHEKVRTLIWEIKYKGNRELMKYIAEILAKEIYIKIKEDPYILIPIPVSKKRRRERGYNQTERIAETILPYLSVTYFPHALLKISHTESQSRTHATKHERAKNLAFSMCIHKKYTAQLKNASVILLDDVTTSGATFAEARRVLENAGVKNVLCVALAH
jgi:competence protein ComFC